MQDIYVVTHAESLHHIEGKVGGWYDTGLTDRGRAQAARVADALEGLTAEAGAPMKLVSSDLMRAIQTAQVIAQRLAIPCASDPDLREMSQGIAHGKPRSWLDERFVPAPDDNRLDHVAIEGGESKRELATRIYAAMTRIAADPARIKIVVTHGYAMSFVIAWWIGMPLDSVGYVNFDASPAGISHLREDDYFRNREVRALNGTAHLHAAP